MVPESTGIDWLSGVPESPGIRPVEVENLHLTLRFIGEVDKNRFEEIREALMGVEAPILKIKLQGAGVFPEGKNPRILYAGMEKNDDLLLLKKIMDRLLHEIGIPNESRIFLPHMTLARFRQPLIQDDEIKIIDFLKTCGRKESPIFEAGEFVLYQSSLHADGARYTEQAAYRLGDETDFLLG